MTKSFNFVLVQMWSFLVAGPQALPLVGSSGPPVIDYWSGVFSDMCLMNIWISSIGQSFEFSDLRLAIESAIFHIYQNTADSISRLKYANCGRKVLGDTVLGFFFGSK